MQEEKIITAEEVEMTEESLKLIDDKINQVVYAEWATTGSMGCCGTARIYVIDGESYTRYVASYFNGQESQYSNSFMILNNASSQNWEAGLRYDGILRDLQNGPKTIHGNSHIFDSTYAGFGNYVWKNQTMKYIDDEEKSGFIIERNGVKYIIECSVKGVYLGIKDWMVGTSTNQ